MWQVELAEKASAMMPDPFEPERLVLRTDDAIIIMEDFSVSRCPSPSPKKYRISGATQPGWLLTP